VINIEESKKHGRITSFTPELKEKILDYVENYAKYGHKVPSVSGLSRVIGKERCTLYYWASDEHNDFTGMREILDTLSAEQEVELINKGLGGDFNPAITKMLLIRHHGYSDAVDLSSKDGSMAPKAAVTHITLEAAEFEQDGES
jgi:hypothetical protein